MTCQSSCARQHVNLFALPAELQDYIFQICLGRWEAILNVPVDEDGDPYRPANLHSNNFEDALSLSIVCKDFAKIVRRAQANKCNYTGHLDLRGGIQYFEYDSARRDQWRQKYYSALSVLASGISASGGSLNTKVFVWTFSDWDPNFAEASHAEQWQQSVHQWLIQNTHHISIHRADRRDNITFENFSSLKHVTFFTPLIHMGDATSSAQLCELHGGCMMRNIRRSLDNKQRFKDGTTLAIEKFLNRGLSLTITNKLGQFCCTSDRCTSATIEAHFDHCTMEVICREGESGWEVEKSICRGKRKYSEILWPTLLDWTTLERASGGEMPPGFLRTEMLQAG